MNDPSLKALSLSIVLFTREFYFRRGENCEVKIEDWWLPQSVDPSTAINFDERKEKRSKTNRKDWNMRAGVENAAIIFKNREDAKLCACV